jgi:hypothetical protein
MLSGIARELLPSLARSKSRPLNDEFYLAVVRSSDGTRFYSRPDAEGFRFSFRVCLGTWIETKSSKLWQCQAKVGDQ